jgi:ubiquinone/menaquinone biosynthesis C-methylase UbiE
LLPVHKVIWHEMRARAPAIRVPEPSAAMDDPEQIRSYVKAYEWGGPTSAVQLYHLRQLARLIRPGDVVLDLACGPGPLMLELAAIYPTCLFIGADLSAGMLAHLQREASARGLGNVRTLQEDIRTLPSLQGTKLDIVISTSALHHLPDTDGLRQVMHNIARLLHDDGGVYLFDFGLLKSEPAHRLMVAHIAETAPPITVQDYDVSLRAAFPIGVVRQMAREAFGPRVRLRKSAFVDFFYFIVATQDRAAPAPAVVAKLDAIERSLPGKYKLEYQMLRLMQTSL